MLRLESDGGEKSSEEKKVRENISNFNQTISKCVTEGDEWRGELTLAQLGSH